jgi:hypothetical protein
VIRETAEARALSLQMTSKWAQCPSAAFRAVHQTLCLILKTQVMILG